MSHQSPHWQGAQTNGKYIVSVDVGTTSIRCFVFDENGSMVSSDKAQVFIVYIVISLQRNLYYTLASQLTQLYPHQGWNELDPEEVWSKFQSVVKNSLQSKHITL